MMQGLCCLGMKLTLMVGNTEPYRPVKLFITPCQPFTPTKLMSNSSLLGLSARRFSI